MTVWWFFLAVILTFSNAMGSFAAGACWADDNHYEHLEPGWDRLVNMFAIWAWGFVIWPVLLFLAIKDKFIPKPTPPMKEKPEPW